MGSFEKVARAWWPVAAWMALIFFASGGVGSGERTSRVLGPILRWMNPEITDATVAGVQLAIRKLAHLFVYAALAVLIWRARRKTASGFTGFSPKEILITLTLCIVYAISDEIHQGFVSGRQGSPWDVLLDGAGALMGLGSERLFRGKK